MVTLVLTECVPLAQYRVPLSQVHSQAFFLECRLHICCSWDVCLLHQIDFTYLRARVVFRLFNAG